MSERTEEKDQGKAIPDSASGCQWEENSRRASHFKIRSCPALPQLNKNQFSPVQPRETPAFEGGKEARPKVHFL